MYKQTCNSGYKHGNDLKRIRWIKTMLIRQNYREMKGSIALFTYQQTSRFNIRLNYIRLNIRFKLFIKVERQYADRKLG